MTRQLIDLPERMASLPRDLRGFPVPKFVAWMDGEPDFRVIKPGWLATCHNERRCWLCGERMGAYQVFVIGPMCGINRVNSEPPSHRECALFAAKNCPFLTRPMATRNERDLPEDHVQAPGFVIARNPGVCLLWTSKTYSLFRVPKNRGGGVLFDIGEPVKVECFCQGRPATRDEVQASVDGGLPILEEAAEQDGREGLYQLRKAMHRFEKLLAHTFKEAA